MSLKFESPGWSEFQTSATTLALIYNDGTMTVSGCTVSGNIAGYYTSTSAEGGGIYNSYAGNLTIRNCVVTGNRPGRRSDLTARRTRGAAR